LPGEEQAMLGFEVLTLAPIDRKLIDLDVLHSEERAWVDSYHQQVLAAYLPQLAGATASWLQEVCAPL
jgi:Xaa-Pro aminopeptidase